MVLPAPAPHAQPRVDGTWLEQLRRILKPRERSLLVRAEAEDHRGLGELVRLVRRGGERAFVCAGVEMLAKVDDGAVVVLCVRAAEVPWLNLNRPLFSTHGWRTVLWVSREVSARIAKQAPDFDDWTSHWLSVPRTPTPHAWHALCELERESEAIVWAGGELDGVLAAFDPAPVRLDAGAPYEELLTTIEAAESRWIVVGSEEARRALAARWAMIEARRAGRVVFVGSDAQLPGYWEVDGRVLDAFTAGDDFGDPRVLELAALLDFEPGALALATRGLETFALDELIARLDAGFEPWSDMGPPLERLVNGADVSASTLRRSWVTQDRSPDPVARLLVNETRSAVELVRHALERGVDDAALSWLGAAPRDVLGEERLELAVRAAQRGEHARALELFEGGLRAGVSASALRRLALELARELGSEASPLAERVLRAALEYAPAPELRAALGRQLTRSRRFEDAEAVLGQELLERDTHASQWLAWAENAAERGRYAVAEQRLRGLASWADGGISARAEQRLRGVLEAQGRFEELAELGEELEQLRTQRRVRAPRRADVLRVECSIGGQAHVGTGFLLATRRGSPVMITALHNIATVEDDSITWHADVNVSYWDGAQTETIELGPLLAHDARRDWAACSTRASTRVRRFEVATFHGQSTTWSSSHWGPSWRAITGTIEGLELPGRDGDVGTADLQLSSAQLVAPGGSPVGYSGAPVVMAGMCVGVITRLASGDGAADGVIHAVPITTVVESLRALGVTISTEDDARERLMLEYLSAGLRAEPEVAERLLRALPRWERVSALDVQTQAEMVLNTPATEVCMAFLTALRGLDPGPAAQQQARTLVAWFERVLPHVYPFSLVYEGETGRWTTTARTPQTLEPQLARLTSGGGLPRVEYRAPSESGRDPLPRYFVDVLDRPEPGLEPTERVTLSVAEVGQRLSMGALERRLGVGAWLRGLPETERFAALDAMMSVEERPFYTIVRDPDASGVRLINDLQWILPSLWVVISRPPSSTLRDEYQMVACIRGLFERYAQILASDA